MNTESEIKDILRSGAKKESKAILINKFTIFEKGNIIKAIDLGGSNCRNICEIVNEVFKNIIKFTGRIENE